MESHAPAVELGEGGNVPDLALPPNIDEYVPLQVPQYGTSPNGQLDHDRIGSQTAQTLPGHSRARSASSMQFVEGQSTEQYASQLVQLLQQSMNSTESLARMPLVENLKQQADGLSTSADPHTATIWQLTGQVLCLLECVQQQLGLSVQGLLDMSHECELVEKLHYAADNPQVEQAMQQCIQDSGFGREQDAVCGWLYEWFRSDDPILQRFVARFAPELAKRYMLQCLSAQPTEPVPGLEACLVAIYEVKSASTEFHRLPNLAQPSVHHTPNGMHTGKAGMHQSPERQTSLSVAQSTHSILPAGVAALFGSPATLSQAKTLSGIRSWQRDAVAGAALRSFCSWMVTYTDAAITAFAHLALSLAAVGCPWIQAEAQHVLQEELKLGNQAITRHTQLPSQTYRLQLSPEILDPLCHGLGHAIYRLAFSMQHSTQLAPGADIPGGPMQRPQASDLQPALGVTTGRVAYSRLWLPYM